MNVRDTKAALQLAAEAALGREVIALVRGALPKRGRPAADAPKRRGRPRKAAAPSKPRAARKPRAPKSATPAVANGPTPDPFGRRVEGLDQ